MKKSVKKTAVAENKKELINRVKSFIWRAGVFVVVALATYIANVSDIREIDPYKLATIFAVTLAAYVINEYTKYKNK